MKLSEYLKKRGVGALALTRIESEAFGVPYPPEGGWARRFANLEITPMMVELCQLMAGRSGDSKSARIVKRALEGAFGEQQKHQATIVTPVGRCLDCDAEFLAVSWMASRTEGYCCAKCKKDANPVPKAAAAAIGSPPWKV